MPALGNLIPFDPIRVAMAVSRRLPWILLTGLLVGAAAGAAAWTRSRTSYSASVQLIRRDLPNSFRVSDLGEAFKPRQLSVASVVSLMRSPTLLARVGAGAQPRLPPAELLRQLVITPEKNTDLISVRLETDRGAEATVALLNRYAQDTVALTRQLQQQEAAELERFLKEQLQRTLEEIDAVGVELLAFSRESDFYNEEKQVEAYLRDLGNIETQIQAGALEQEAVRFRIAGIRQELERQNPALLQLTAAREELAQLLVRYTEANPRVQEQRLRIRSLEEDAARQTNAVSEFRPGGNTVANSLFVDLVTLEAQAQALALQQKPLEERRHQIQARLTQLPEKALNHARLRSHQQSLEAARALLEGRQREARLFSENAPGYYRLFAPAAAEDVREASRTRKTAALAVAGWLAGCGLAGLFLGFLEVRDDRMVSPGDMRRSLGCPTLAQLGPCDGALPQVTEAWRFRTWSALVRELGDAGTGSVTAGITSTRHGEGRSTWIRLLEQAAAEQDACTLVLTGDPSPDPAIRRLPLAQALEEPGRVSQALAAVGPGRVALIAGPDWEWTAPRRAAWTAAVALWSRIPRLALLVELPPAGEPETWRLARTLPRLLWVCRSGSVPQSEAEERATLLRESGRDVDGILATGVPEAFARWPDLARFGLALAFASGLALQSPARGAEAAAAAPSPPVLSATAAPPRLAPWQERLTLGPGDQVNLSVYGHPELTRSDIALGPDGRISYLHVQGFPAAGLTLDELRERLTAEIQSQIRSARVVVTPSAFRSKKYFLLGTVIDRGAYPLDRPMTLIEAIARARGIATGLLEQNTVEIADLPRAFLVRQQRRMPVDFVRLFRDGDLTQNIPIEPGDYIYLPSSVLNEAYILGSVASPGTVGVNEFSSVVGVLTVRGGFTEKAWRQKVLVIRGSLDRPESFVVNVAEILRGNLPDFPLQPKDIIYIADRPWARAEELLDMAIVAFMTTAITTWSGQNIGPFITNPIIPSTK